MERLLAERRGHLGLRDQLELDRQGADAQALGEVVGRVEVADVLDLRAGAAVDALRVLDEVDRRQRDDLVVERDREVLEELRLVASRRAEHGSASKPRCAIRFVTRANASRPLSVNSIVTSGAFVFGSNACFGFLMSAPEQLGVVLEHVEAL